jgi:glycosyltransferase involved in cell wall biosynthesis|tara:strand:+ start:2869 stop:3543 length:675 start_codon:yes stop_codon:yes gene_type:complete
MSTAVVITTLNEIDGVKELLPKIKKEWAEEWLVVDGNSNDGTVDEVKKLGFNIALQKKKGHGDAVSRGVSDTKSDFILYWGPDGNHELQEIPRLIEKIKEGFDQIVISRFGKTSVNLDAGRMDTFGNKMFTFLVNMFFGGRLTDALNLSRIITRKSMLQLKFDADGLDSTTQMSIRALKQKHKIIAISGNEGRRIGGKRKMEPIPVGWDLTKLIILEFIFWNNR